MYAPVRGTTRSRPGLPDLRGDGFKTLAKRPRGSPSGSGGKESACNAGDVG